MCDDKTTGVRAEGSACWLIHKFVESWHLVISCITRGREPFQGSQSCSQPCLCTHTHNAALLNGNADDWGVTWVQMSTQENLQAYIWGNSFMNSTTMVFFWLVAAWNWILTTIHLWIESCIFFKRAVFGSSQIVLFTLVGGIIMRWCYGSVLWQSSTQSVCHKQHKSKDYTVSITVVPREYYKWCLHLVDNKPKGF